MSNMQIVWVCGKSRLNYFAKTDSKFLKAMLSDARAGKLFHVATIFLRLYFPIPSAVRCDIIQRKYVEPALIELHAWAFFPLFNDRIFHFRHEFFPLIIHHFTATFIKNNIEFESKNIFLYGKEYEIEIFEWTRNDTRNRLVSSLFPI